MKTLGVVIVVIAVGGGGWFGYKHLADAPDGEEFVARALVRGDIVRTVSATGTIEPLIKVIVGSQVSGNIKKWYADFNDKVTRGFVLAELDPDRFETAFQQAEAELALAQARAEELQVRFKDAQRERKRLQALHEQKNASDNELQVAQAEEDATQAAWQGALASVKSAEARLSAAQVDLAYTIIRSPIDGVVIARNIDEGQTVAASLQAPELFLIANDLARMQVNANVSESDVGLISEGMPAAFRVDAYPDRTFTGAVSQIRYNATVVDGVVTYVTLIEVSNDDLALRPGMTANVTFEVARASGVLRIPNAALRFSPMPPSAMAARSSGRKTRRTPKVYILKGGRPKAVEVKIGLSDGSLTELVEGLEEGAEVIIERNWQGGSGRRTNPARSLRRR